MTPPKTLKERQREEVRPVVSALLEPAASRDLNAAMLEQSGALQRSLHAERGRNAAIAGVNLICAAIHQFGAKKSQFASKKGGLLPWSDIPAPPFLGVRGQERKQIHNAILNHLRGRPQPRQARR